MNLEDKINIGEQLRKFINVRDMNHFFLCILFVENY